MKRREFIALLGGAAATATFAFAQVSTQRPIVGVLLAGSSTNALFLNMLAQGMQEIGYIEGQDIDIVSRYADGDLTRMPALAAELTRQKPAVVVTGNSGGTRAIRDASAAIPTRSDSALSRVRPGPEGRSLACLTLDTLPGKQLQLLLEAVPGVKRIGMLLNVNNPATVVHIGGMPALPPPDWPSSLSPLRSVCQRTSMTPSKV